VDAASRMARSTWCSTPRRRPGAGGFFPIRPRRFDFEVPYYTTMAGAAEATQAIQALNQAHLKFAPSVLLLDVWR